ncbi:hypothetical protein F0344_34035 [Streptomyces finlayi]|uniref:Uncharacterized protein n=1 Tax=Streptomyces finlayi TaxID=67296 RepID=A0A7G7BUC8_9ACTN|nr:hypothetical protein [Streptomyces finlayi]QNE78943.1 hypothetical protein F0344_34035 [Streptomyces finlayi]
MERLLPAVAARLDDSATEVRFRAVELPACLGPATAAHADEAAALFDDHAARSTRHRQTVAEGAVCAPARMNDPRCLAGRIERIAGPATGFASHSAMSPAADWHLIRTR